MTELNGKHQYPLREGAHYGSTLSLRSLASDNSGICASSIQNLDFSSGSLISLHDKIENHSTMRRRSPSLPPIHTNKEHYQNFIQVIYLFFIPLISIFLLIRILNFIQVIHLFSIHLICFFLINKNYVIIMRKKEKTWNGFKILELLFPRHYSIFINRTRNSSGE